MAETLRGVTAAMRTDKDRQANKFPDTQSAASTRELSQPYGDFYRLDTYPWVADTEDYEEGIPREAIQEHRDTFDTPHGLVRRYWRVTGPEEIGLPRRSESEMHIELLLRTIVAGSDSCTIKFSYRELASFLGMRSSPHSDERVGLALSRLVGVKVHFQAQTARSTEKEFRLLAFFGLVQNADTVVEEAEMFGSLRWDPSVLASLRPLVETQSAGSINEGSDTKEAQVSALRPLVRAFLTPAAEGTTALWQVTRQA